MKRSRTMRQKVNRVFAFFWWIGARICEGAREDFLG